MSNDTSHEDNATRSWDRRSVLRLMGGASLSLAAGSLLAACTGLDAREDDRVTVQIVGQMQIDPNAVTVSPGTTVIFENLSALRHALTTDPEMAQEGQQVSVPEGVEPWDTGEMTAGVTFEYEFTEPGTYVYACRLHPDAQMTGVVTVEEE